MGTSRSFAHDPFSLSDVRTLVREILAEEVGSSSSPAELVASELAAALIEASEAPLAVRVAVDERIRVEVEADGRERQPVGEESALRLMMVQNLACDWGADDRGDTVVLWAEVPLPLG